MYKVYGYILVIEEQLRIMILKQIEILLSILFLILLYLKSLVKFIHFIKNIFYNLTS